MLGLHKYLSKISNIKWIFEDDMLTTLQQILYVDFKKENNYFLIEKIHYTYVDILLGLEELDFEVNKQGEDLEIKILKI